MTTCRICRGRYSSSAEDKKLHADEHKKLAKGLQPYDVLEFCKAFGWAVAHNDNWQSTNLEFYRNDHEVGKLVVAYSWWNRARKSDIPLKDFDAFMISHLALIDAQVNNEHEEAAQLKTREWEQYSG